jgi:hypothetical protein
MGEISLAHHGVLFLDEFPKFKRSALEALHEPLESGTITIPRAAHHSGFPARYQLIGAINPCPCGFLFHFYNISEVKSEPMIHGHDTMDSTVVAFSSMDLRASARWSSSAPRLLNTRL